MKKKALLILTALIIAPLLTNAQSFVDPDQNVEAKVFAYKLDAAPTIDGSDTEWGDIPWQALRYNDKDFNGDNLADPFPSRRDYQSKFKSAWVNGSNVVYFLVNIEDDQFYTADSVNWYNVDGLEIRLDPFDTEAAGEPSDAGTAFNIGFKVGQNELNGIEGPAPSAYEAFWVVDENSTPKKAQLELAITLPDNLPLQENYIMGFYLYCSDNDLGRDDSPTSKDAATVLWPQLYSSVGGGAKIGVDAVWEHVYLWGNMECISLNVTEVAAGGSIQAAVDAASEGGIIKIAAGEFSENIVINTPYVQLIGTMTATDTTKITPADGNSAIVKIADDDAAYGVVVKNIAFYGWATDENNNQVTGGKGVETGSAQTAVVGCYFEGFDQPIIMGAVGETKAYAGVFEDNYLYKCSGGINFHTPSTIMRYNTAVEGSGGYPLDSKGLLAESSVDIAYNTVFNHHGECAVGYGGSGVFTIHHNMFVRSEQLYGAGDTSGDDGIENQDEGGSTDYIYNNTIVGWKSDGMQLGNGTSNFYVRNNLTAHCAGKDYDIRNVGSTDIDYGLSFSNGTNLIETLGSSFVTGDPLFTDEFGDDFTITENSPAVDAGVKEPFGFKVMYFGEGVDIGAFETGSAGTVGIEDEEGYGIPADYSLEQNYPNPFNPTTNIRFSLSNGGMVSLKIYNLLGEEVAALVNQEMGAGVHTVSFNASSLSSGMYFYTLKVGEFSSTKKMMLIK